MYRRALISLAVASLVVWTPAAAQVSTPSSVSSTLVAGQKVEGPIQVTTSIGIVYYYLGETSSGTRLIGEIENTSDAPVIAPPFQVQGLDENGDPYGDSFYVLVVPIVLAPGERMVISGEVGSGLPPESFGSMMFTASERSGAYAPLPVEIEGIPARGKTKDISGKKGAIRNTGDSVIDIDILESWFAPDGTALGTCFGTTSGSIPPGKALPIQSIQPLGGCVNVSQGADILGVNEDDETGYAIQVYAYE